MLVGQATVRSRPGNAEGSLEPQPAPKGNAAAKLGLRATGARLDAVTARSQCRAQFPNFWKLIRAEEAELGRSALVQRVGGPGAGAASRAAPVSGRPGSEPAFFGRADAPGEVALNMLFNPKAPRSTKYSYADHHFYRKRQPTAASVRGCSYDTYRIPAVKILRPSHFCEASLFYGH